MNHYNNHFIAISQCSSWRFRDFIFAVSEVDSWCDPRPFTRDIAVVLILESLESLRTERYSMEFMWIHMGSYGFKIAVESLISI